MAMWRGRRIDMTSPLDPRVAAPALNGIAAVEGGTAPLPLFQLLALLTRLQDNLVRPVTLDDKGEELQTPAQTLHIAGLTKLVSEWLKTDDSRQRQMDTWTVSRQLCVWQMYVPLSLLAVTCRYSRQLCVWQMCVAPAVTCRHLPSPAVTASPAVTRPSRAITWTSRAAASASCEGV